jgi:hypothetical protein
MSPRKSEKPVTALDGEPASKIDQLGGKVNSTDSASQGQPQEICIVVKPTASGRKWRASLDGKALCTSTSPLVAAARVLIASGHDPHAIIEMWHRHADGWSLRGCLGAVAVARLEGEVAPNVPARRARNVAPIRFTGKGSYPKRGGSAMSIECAFHGFLAADADARTSQAGKPWVRLRVGVGKDDAVQWLNVAVFGKAAEIAATLKKGDRVYAEGSIKLDTWRGNDQHRTSRPQRRFVQDRAHASDRAQPA